MTFSYCSSLMYDSMGIQHMDKFGDFTELKLDISVAVQGLLFFSVLMMSEMHKDILCTENIQDYLFNKMC